VVTETTEAGHGGKCRRRERGGERKGRERTALVPCTGKRVARWNHTDLKSEAGDAGETAPGAGGAPPGPGGAKTALHKQFPGSGVRRALFAVLGPIWRPRRACPARGVPGDFGRCSGALWARSAGGCAAWGLAKSHHGKAFSGMCLISASPAGCMIPLRRRRRRPA